MLGAMIKFHSMSVLDTQYSNLAPYQSVSLVCSNYQTRSIDLVIKMVTIANRPIFCASKKTGAAT